MQEPTQNVSYSLFDFVPRPFIMDLRDKIIEWIKAHADIDDVLPTKCFIGRAELTAIKNHMLDNNVAMANWNGIKRMDRFIARRNIPFEYTPEKDPMILLGVQIIWRDVDSCLEVT
jgi:hypothetical protein